MMKYGVTVSDLAKITGWSYPPTLDKIHMRSYFSFADMLKIKQYFQSKGVNMTVDEIFYDWLDTDESGNGKVLTFMRKYCCKK
jgi:hypothetical protein